jgi:hypothetical protein
MTTATLNLDEANILEAIQMWTRSKGYRPTGAPAALRHEKGDRPAEGETFSASIAVEPLPACTPNYPDPYGLDRS